MKKKWIVIPFVFMTFLLGFSMAGPLMSKVEVPKYTIISSIDSIEIRQYPSMIIAEVTVQGRRKEAINAGFRILANYIFGNNTLEQNIEMTAPVQQEKNAKIAMTAPVQQQASNNDWKVSFIMPSSYTLATLPKPNNKQIVLQEIKEKQFVAIRFSGTGTSKPLSKHESLLQAYIMKNRIQTVGLPKYAFYNPPWTLPFMRRNEIMIEIQN